MDGVTPESTHGVLGQWILASGLPLVCDLNKSHASFLHDSKTGADFLDFFCFFASRPLGFNHPKLREAAFVESLDRAARIKPSNCDIYTLEYADFTQAFAEKALQGLFRHVFFVEGGSPAVENAVKAAIDWKHRKNMAAGRGEKGRQIVHFAQAFHGRTGYSLSLTDSHDPRKGQFYPKFSWPRITNPKMRFPFDADAEAAVVAAEQKALRDIHEAFDAHPDDIAAVIIEPIQGEGGDNYFRPEFLLALRQICDEREALLIFDEVQTGFGATGAWWHWQNMGVQPDLMVFGKKTQVCGFAATDRIDEVAGVFQVPSRISSTFEGNLSDMVRCSRIIDVILEDELLANAAAMGQRLLDHLSALQHECAALKSLRGQGLWVAFDLPDAQMRDALLSACYAEHLLVLPCGERSVRAWMPPSRACVETAS